MIPKECKRLAEVDFPLAEVSKHAVREKSIRHGHPSTLHLWWARRPLASCRAMLLALLLPDPCDEHCPANFSEKAREVLGGMFPVADGDDGLRKALLKFIGDVANWDIANNQRWIGVARDLVKAAYSEEAPLVVDPFAGGGSIPLEALRLGCDAFASDLNPVACLILKVLLEDIPRYGSEMAGGLRRTGKQIKEVVDKELKGFYPDDPDGAKPIAYLWARTVRCEAPNCGAEIPLVKSFWLCKKTKRKRALRYLIERLQGAPPTLAFEIFEPKSEKDVPVGTVNRARATCPSCGAVLRPDRVRAQLVAQHGGADVIFDSRGRRIGGSRLLAVVTLRAVQLGRHYRLASQEDYQHVLQSHRRLEAILRDWQIEGDNGLCPVPNEPTPWKGGHRSAAAPRLYGMDQWGQLSSQRQKLALIHLSSAIREVLNEGATELRVLALALSKLTELTNANSWWEPVAECPRTIFGRHDLPATWDYAEGVPTSESSGSFAQVMENCVANVSAIGSDWGVGQVQQSDAMAHPLPDGGAQIWFTDPPYYDAVAYSDLSDFFHVWLKRSSSRYLFDLRESNTTQLTPKAAELSVTTIAAENGTPKTGMFFETGMGQAFCEGRRVLDGSGVGCVVFAHNTTEGWESLLTAALGAGWTIVASWPVSTEQRHRLNARENASLATSIHLVCRPRPDDASVGDWGQVLAELPKRVGDWMERLQGEGIRGADLVFACIGPALEIFSRYRRVETADGEEVKLDKYLEKVWEVVGRSALEQILGTAEARARNGAAGALEEDARLTALFLWTQQSSNGKTNKNGASNAAAEEDEEPEESTDEDSDSKVRPKKGYCLIYDVVRRFAQPLGIQLPKWEGRIIETSKGVVRLLPVTERATQIFGEQGEHDVVDWLESDTSRQLQLTLFPDLDEVQPPKIRGRRGHFLSVGEQQVNNDQETTTLDRVHTAMLLQKGGQANGLRALIKSEQERGPDFLRLANALSALYPKDSEEKRLLDAMLLAVPR